MKRRLAVLTLGAVCQQAVGQPGDQLSHFGAAFVLGLEVTVHNLGSVAAPATELVLFDRAGQERAKARIPATRPPNDLLPKTAVVTIQLPAGFKLEGARRKSTRGARCKKSRPTTTSWPWVLWPKIERFRAPRR